jgi:hypothetical protein
VGCGPRRTSADETGRERTRILERPCPPFAQIIGTVLIWG